MTPLDIATEYDKIENMRALLDAGADVNIVTAEVDPAIFFARSVGAARLLISRHVNVNARSVKDQLGDTALIDRATKIVVASSDEDAANDVAIAQLLIEADADVNAIGGDGNTPLRECVTDHGLPCVIMLLNHGANPNPPTTENYRSPLAQAIYMQGEEQAAMSVAMTGKAPDKQIFHDIEAILRAHGASE